MQKKSQDFSMEDALQLANSPAGQQLMALLQKQDHQTMEQAAAAASSGNYQQASQALKAFLSTPETKKLLKELGGNPRG